MTCQQIRRPRLANTLNLGDSAIAGPTVIADEICRMYRMSVIGETDEI